MKVLVVLVFAASSVAAGEPFEASASRAISDFVTQELSGHYDVESLELVEVRERDGEIGGPYPGYGFRTIQAIVVAVRNGQWSQSLNRGIPNTPECESEVELYLLCRTAGYKFTGQLEVDLVATTDGWKILSRLHRSLRRYPLSRYLHCAADKPGATDREIINGCFASAPIGSRRDVK
jgi:hypothetical protein